MGAPAAVPGGATASSPPPPGPSSRVRLYEVFPGRNRFLCRGMCMTGPDKAWPHSTISLIVVSSALFIAFPCVDYVDRGEAQYMVVACVLLALTVGGWLRTSLSDPGVVPRKPRSPESLASSRQAPRTLNVVANGRAAELKFCGTCNIYRPPRAVHCSECDNCVEVFDHHCPWVGNCVGRGNYRAFVFFLVACTAHVVFVFVASVRHMVLYSRDDSFGAALRRDPTSLFTAVLSFVFFWFVGGLLGFHIYLRSTGQTTNEMLKGSFPFRSPYSRGGCGNWSGLCCRLPESENIRRRTKVDPATGAPLKAPRVVHLEVIPAAEGKPRPQRRIASPRASSPRGSAGRGSPAAAAAEPDSPAAVELDPQEDE